MPADHPQLEPLKLIALDEDDLQVISAHVQDAVARASDLKFLAREKRFVAMLNRFEWRGAASDRKQALIRRRAALRFDRVLNVQAQNPRPGSAVAALLAVRFEPSDPPGGHIHLIFAGDFTLRLQIECIEAELRDLGGVWRARAMPRHPEDDGAGA